MINCMRGLFLSSAVLIAAFVVHPMPAEATATTGSRQMGTRAANIAGINSTLSLTNTARIAPQVRAVTRAPRVPNNSVSPCPAAGSANIYPVYGYSNQSYCPAASTRIIYVSSSNGNNANSGSTPAQAVRTAARAMELLHASPQPTWLVFKRGDVFEEGIRVRANLAWNLSTAQPLVFTGYGAGSVRPIFRNNGGFATQGAAVANFRNVIINGLHFQSRPGLGGTGYLNLDGGSDLVIEDSRFEGFVNAITIQQFGSSLPTERVAIRNNVFLNTASGPGAGGHSSTMYIYRSKDLVIENNLMDFGGYFGNRNTGLGDQLVGCRQANGNIPALRDYPTSCPPDTTPVMADTFATIFNHHLYLQYDGWPAVVRNNIISRASSHGMQARSGGNIDGNIFARNPLGMSFSSGGQDPANSAVSIVTRNVVLEGNDINSSLPRGFGIDHDNAYNSAISDNIIANTMTNAGRHNKIAVSIICAQRVQGALAPPGNTPCNSLVENNLVYKWDDGISGTPLRLRLDQNNSLYGAINLSRNQLYASGSEPRKQILRIEGDSLSTAGNRVSFMRNAYGAIETNSRLEVVIASSPYTVRGIQDWINPQTGNDPMGSVGPVPSFLDACRTLATYVDDVIMGNRTNNNCDIMHDDALYNQFMTMAAAGKNRLAPDPRFNTETVANYLRQGFAPANR